MNRIIWMAISLCLLSIPSLAEKTWESQARRAQTSGRIDGPLVSMENSEIYRCEAWSPWAKVALPDSGFVTWSRAFYSINNLNFYTGKGWRAKRRDTKVYPTLPDWNGGQRRGYVYLYISEQPGISFVKRDTIAYEIEYDIYDQNVTWIGSNGETVSDKLTFFGWNTDQKDGPQETKELFLHADQISGALEKLRKYSKMRIDFDRLGSGTTSVEFELTGSGKNINWTQMTCGRPDLLGK